MQKKTLGWLIIAGVLAVFGAVGWLAYVQGSTGGLFAVIASLVLGAGAAVAVKLRERRFVRNAVSGHARVHDSVVFESDPQHGLVQVAMLLEFEGVGVAAGHRIYRIFRLPARQLERYAAGARLPVRVLPQDLSVVQILAEDEPTAGGRRAYVEARESQTPLDSYA
ncbi:hypothetical protein [Catellatospora sichuanensis]|uniref:hypothetical protein n=1 Tax=Catellatospora sichuanensis TaxID=1969805 RepID=UPI0011843B0D|nr:hypothetical protein [Catellatospora sichuanensis]